MSHSDDVGQPAIQVAAGIIVHEGRYLIAKRPAGGHLAGSWEFPGGKREPGETLEACLHRELWEELSVRVREVVYFCSVRHDYPEKTVELHFFRCRLEKGMVLPATPGVVEWVGISEFGRYQFPEADQPVIARLNQEGEVPS